MKTNYVIHISPDTPDTIEETLQDLTKIQKIVRHADIHGQEILKDIVQKLKDECTSDFPDAFWTREKYFVSLPYKEGFKDTPQKASANNMSPSDQALCQEEIQHLLDRHLIEPFMSPWACPTFYVNKHSEQKRGKKRLVINYKALNSALLPLRYPLPHKEILFSKLAHANVFSKFDLKSGFWQLGISPEDRYKTAFVVPQGKYQWTVMPFSLTNAPSEFQKRMEDIFKPLNFVLVYIDDLLIFSRDVNEHKKHLDEFHSFVFKHGLVLSKSPEKFVICKTNIEYLGLYISKGTIQMQPHVLKALLQFPDFLPDIKQVQRFLGCLNYIR
jgi:hypothetical protein